MKKQLLIKPFILISFLKLSEQNFAATIPTQIHKPSIVEILKKHEQHNNFKIIAQELIKHDYTTTNLELSIIDIIKFDLCNISYDYFGIIYYHVKKNQPKKSKSELNNKSRTIISIPEILKKTESEMPEIVAEQLIMHGYNLKNLYFSLKDIIKHRVYRTSYERFYRIFIHFYQKLTLKNITPTTTLSEQKLSQLMVPADSTLIEPQPDTTQTNTNPIDLINPSKEIQEDITSVYNQSLDYSPMPENAFTSKFNTDDVLDKIITN